MTHFQVLFFLFQRVDVSLESVERLLVGLLVLLLLQNGFVQFALDSFHFLVAFTTRSLQFLVQLQGRECEKCLLS